MSATGIDRDVYERVAQMAKDNGTSIQEVSSQLLRFALGTEDVQELEFNVRKRGRKPGTKNKVVTPVVTDETVTAEAAS